MEAILHRHYKNHIEYNVKHYGFKFDIPESIDAEANAYFYEFVEEYAEECFKEIQKLKYKWVVDWCFSGRSIGWFCIETNIELDSINKWEQIDKITQIVEKYYMNLDKRFENELKKYLLEWSK